MPLLSAVVNRGYIRQESPNPIQQANDNDVAASLVERAHVSLSSMPIAKGRDVDTSVDSTDSTPKTAILKGTKTSPISAPSALAPITRASALPTLIPPGKLGRSAESLADVGLMRNTIEQAPDADEYDFEDSADKTPVKTGRAFAPLMSSAGEAKASVSDSDTSDIEEEIESLNESVDDGDDGDAAESRSSKEELNAELDKAVRKPDSAAASRIVSLKEKDASGSDHDATARDSSRNVMRLQVHH